MLAMTWQLSNSTNALSWLTKAWYQRSTCTFRGISTDVRSTIEQTLRQLLPDPTQITTSADSLQLHGKDEGYLEPKAPDIVVYPMDNDQVSKIVSTCNQHAVPVIPFGVGTSVEGHVAAVKGGVCMDMSRMNQVLEVNVEDMDCRVQAGCTRLTLAAALRHTGLFFPVDPGADATLGGMAATRASGTNAVRYGTMREAVLGLTAVLPDGSIIKTGKRVRKTSAGYDLTHLLVGAEGTLGVITEVCLRLHAVPECISAAVCTFKDLQGAVQSVQAIMCSSIPVARVEILDGPALAAVNKFCGTSYTEAPTLFFEFHGSKQGVAEQSEAVAAITAEHGSSQFAWATEPEQRDALWKARHKAYWAAVALRPGCRGFPTDVCVPITKLADAIQHAQQAVSKAGLLAPMVGHVGDGNFHMMTIVDPHNRAEVEAAKKLSSDIAEHALSIGGTCSGEHGVGHGKLQYMKKEHGGIGPLKVMHAIKKALDPNNILNPGKLGSNPMEFIP